MVAELIKGRISIEGEEHIADDICWCQPYLRPDGFREHNMAEEEGKNVSVTEVTQ